MNLIDDHCHLTHVLYKDDLNDVLARAKTAGIKRILVSGVNPLSNREVLKLVQQHPDILRASLGIYPIDALGLAEGDSGLPLQKTPIDIDQELLFFKEHKDHITAIGEIGMDFHWAAKEQTYQQQATNFRKIIRFAKSINKPIVIHSRKAEAECIQILAEEIPNHEIPIIQHCFSGKKSLIKQAAELGHYFSIPTNLIKSDQFQTLIKLVPLQQITTETDGPWLSPYKDQKNEPAFVRDAIQKIAEIKGITPQQTADQIWQNYCLVYGEK